MAKPLWAQNDILRLTERDHSPDLELTLSTNIQHILITGATGGVGQLAVAYGLNLGYQVRALTRNMAKARPLFDERVALVEGDLRQPDTLVEPLAGIDAVLCCSGTTAFPSDRWQVEAPPQP